MVKKESVEHILDYVGRNNPISDDYWPGICRAILNDVVKDVRECADNDAWNEDDVRLAVGRVLCARLGIDKDGEPIVDNDKYDVVQLPWDDIPALFVDGRVKRSLIPKGLYAYDLRGSDDDPGEPCNLEAHVVVNHAGTVITATEITIPECGYLDLGEGLNFLGDSMTMSEFKEAMQKEVRHGVQQ